MKKLILSAAIVLGSLTSFAATPVHTPQTQISVTQDDFAEIGVDKLPEAVIKATEKAYPGATIVKAYMNQENQYKLDLTVSDKAATVYADAEGNWITK